MTHPRVLVLDIETSPIVGLVWALRDQNLSVDMIVKDWSILCYCAKWLGSDKVIREHTGGRGKSRVRDDKRLCRSLWALLDEADFVIAQNGKNFDLKMIDGRMLQHGMLPYSPVRVIDTLLASRRRFRHPSHKLAYQASRLTDTPKSTHKNFPGMELWTEVEKDNPRAWKEMLDYCEVDVRACEKVYMRQRPWIRSHPNMAVFVEDDEPRCPTCASDRLQSRGRETTQQGAYRRYHCQCCGAWPRGKIQQLHHTVRKSLLVSA